MGINFNPGSEKFNRAVRSEINVETGTFENDMVTFHSKDDVFTLLVHLGYLAYDYEYRCVYIPNNEVKGEFANSVPLVR